jgi:hypothetical protein
MPNNKVRRNGSYAPLSAHYYKDDAVAAVGEKAELLFLRGLAFCADVLSDGFISDLQLTRFVGIGLGNVQGRAQALVAAGLWTRDDERGGYWVRSWEKWNQLRAEIEEKLHRDANRKTGAES